MSNRLYQLANAAVHRAETSAHAVVTSEELREAQNKLVAAKNDVSSAFANSSIAEKEQLQQMQQRLVSVENYLNEGNHPHF